MHAVDAYASDVVAGRVPAGKWHKLACARHLRDRQREGTPEFPYRFDLAKAEKFFRFAELLRHYKGEWAGQPIRLEPWQKFIPGLGFGGSGRPSMRCRERTARRSWLPSCCST
jgi:phage terminase large subunit-like protein